MLIYTHIISEMVKTDPDYETGLSMLVAGVLGELEADTTDENIKKANYLSKGLVNAVSDCPSSSREFLLTLASKLDEYIEANKGGE